MKTISAHSSAITSNIMANQGRHYWTVEEEQLLKHLYPNTMHARRAFGAQIRGNEWTMPQLAEQMQVIARDRGFRHRDYTGGAMNNRVLHPLFLANDDYRMRLERHFWPIGGRVMPIQPHVRLRGPENQVHMFNPAAGGVFGR